MSGREPAAPGRVTDHPPVIVLGADGTVALRRPGMDGLLVTTDSPVHRLPSHAKILALVAFALVVVSTPPGSWWAFAAYGALLAGVIGVARVPGAVVVRRLVVETPFVVFALMLPLVATGPRVEIGPVSLAEEGLVGGGTLLAKATLGVAAAIVLAATTTVRDLLAGLDRLRLPRTLVAILSFMLRYASVVADDLRRMRIARESRGAVAGRLGDLRAVAAGVGTLFVRSYERGERVHLAMLARGYTGRVPPLAGSSARPAQWVASAALPGAALLVLAIQRAVGGT